MQILNYKINFKLKLGIISLVILFYMGIFSTISYATQTVRQDVLASQTYGASFSYDIGELHSRIIYPDRAYYNSSGTLNLVSPVTASNTPNYPDWATNYTTKPWSGEISSLDDSSFYQQSMQVGQIPASTSMSLSPGTILVSKMNFSDPKDIVLNAYSNETDLFTTPMSGFPHTIDTVGGSNNLAKAHSMVISKSKVYFFWLNSDNHIHLATYNGTTYTADTTLSNSDVNISVGLSGCLIDSAGTEYIAMAYSSSSTSLKVVTFKEGDFPNTATSTINIANISSTQTTMYQNPRTKKIYISWTDGGIAYYKECTYSPPNSWVYGPSQAIVSSWQENYGMSVAGFSNFETAFSLPSPAVGDNVVKDILLRSTTSINSTFSPYNGYPCVFPYNANNTSYAGLVIMQSFHNFRFFRRPLTYPSSLVWQKSNKTLHLEGPPLLNTNVSIEVDFAELATSSCLISTANSAGGRTPINGSDNVIASSGNLITLKFDKSMNQTNYPGMINNQIKMLDSSNNPINLSYSAGNSNANSISFTTDPPDLSFNSNYRISIASDVFDSNGSQIWGPATLSFSTQKAQSHALASEVIRIDVYRDAARTNFINNNDEVNATSTVYFKLTSVDPAFNTIDTATLSVYLDTTNIQDLTLTQSVASSTFFYGQYNISAPTGGSHTYEFRTASSTVNQFTRVNFPTISSVSPPNASSGVKINVNPVITFSENLSSSSINIQTVRLTREGVSANFSVSLSSDKITIDPDDNPEGYMYPDTTYTISAGYSVKDTVGNPFVNSPATYTSTFTTQASQTKALSISNVKLYSDAAFTNLLTHNSDYPATGTLYIEMIGSDAEPLTKDYTTASISTGVFAKLTETASSTGIYRGSTSFASLPDSFQLKVESKQTSTAGESLLITYPHVSPDSPASGAVNVLVNSTITVLSDEKLDATTVNAANVTLTLSGANVNVTRSYNAVTKKITLTPTSLLGSEKKYLVTVKSTKDMAGNPQQQTLSYSFTTQDIIPPTIQSSTPNNNETGVTIDRNIRVKFSENILPSSANTSTIKLTRGGTNASYSVVVTGDLVTIEPDDAPDASFKPETNYLFEIGPSVTDMSGNKLSNVPATFSINFTTQPYITAPVSVTSLNLYKDSLLSVGYSSGESIPATSTIYLKVTGTDGATQTQDIATITLALSWGGNYTIKAKETASNSTGLYTGSFDLSSIPIYDFPAPLPPVASGNIKFSTVTGPVQSKYLYINFPELLSAGTVVKNLTGEVLASGATNVRVDTDITTTFTEAINSSIDSSSLSVSSGSTAIPGTYSISADEKSIKFTPNSNLPFSSNIFVSGLYKATGLKANIGNPLFRSFTYRFTTQSAQTPPSSISSVKIYPNSSFNAIEAYEHNGDFPGTGEIFIQAIGTDVSPTTIDQTIVSISGAPNLALSETSNNSGVFRGSYTYSNLSDLTNLKVTSLTSLTASSSLLLSYPRLSVVMPASGSTDVSIITPIKLNVSEKADASTINSTNVKLLKSDNSQLPGTVSCDTSTNNITFTPSSPLEFSNNYRIEANNISDIAGNKQLTQLISTFQTQATAISPTTINSIKLYSDSAYSSLLTDNSLVAPSTNVYIEISGNDLSATTIDTTQVRISSDKNGTISLVTLIETSVNSGIFRNSSSLFQEEGATLTFASNEDLTKLTHLKTYLLPEITSIQPASGSTNLYLNSTFKIKTNKNLAPLTVDNSNIKLFDKNGISSYAVSLSAPDEISISSLLATDSEILLEILSGIKDSDGISLNKQMASFTTRKPVYTNFKLFSDNALSTSISANSSVEPGQTIYTSFSVTDLYFNNTESYTGSYASNSGSGSFILQEVTPGQFKGSFTVPIAGSETLSIKPDIAPSLAININVLPSFGLISFSPASGATAVAADSWPTWNFSRVVDSASINLTEFNLKDLSTGLNVPGTLSASKTGKQVRFQPSLMLKLLTNFEMSAKSSIKDTNGNTLGKDFVSHFQTQPPPPPPLVIDSLTNYETSAYATSTHAVATNGVLHLELKANDTSFSTYDTARLRIDSSDGSIDGDEVVLVEISPPSGIYRLTYPINLPVGTEINIVSQVNTAFKLKIVVYPQTTLTSIVPASSSTNLFLDRQLSVSFDRSISADDLPKGIFAFDSLTNPVSLDFSQSNSGKTINITPVNQWATGSTHIIKITTSLHDTNGLFVLPTNFSFSTKPISTSTFELYTGIGSLSGQLVSETKEANIGALNIIATTSNMFENKQESRQITFTTATGTYFATMPEVSPGVFSGTTTIGNQPNSSIAAKMNFGSFPVINFNVAKLPDLVSINPASGSTKVSEYPLVTATFTSIMSKASFVNSGVFNTPTGQIKANLVSNNDSNTMAWTPSSPLPSEASCSIHISGITDYLGQSSSEVISAFSTGGSKGISIYSDSTFTTKIITEDIAQSIVYVEVSASSSANINSRDFYLEIVTERNSTQTKLLKLTRVSNTSAKFRCTVKFEQNDSVSGYNVPLLPGEWIEFASSNLTNEKRKYYYKLHGAQPPINIKSINFYSEKYFARQISNIFQQPSLYIEVLAEDRNWLSSDTTILKVYSESDTTGFRLPMSENGLHSEQFRNYIKVNLAATIARNNYLKVLPGERVWVTSETDPTVKASIRYLPINSIGSIYVYPSPARGNKVTFTFYLTFPGNLELNIYDVSGDEVASRYIRGQEGENRYTWRIPSHVANGVYFFKLKLENDTAYPTGKRKARGKFAILR